ncbi:butyrophilin subfamily 1 member A1-like [Acipenser ruthenus]|uniref:butyrophilin subfamily 1 member A1-like n=1 Tax=Acipenser ruthenus TaxID=7906 RepID=UPI0027427D2C|nr:butyrophilin subfamily 1 member A1-like [Acipenser ruthenus]
MKMRLLGGTCLIVLSLLPAVSTQRGGWRVVGSDHPVIAEAGDDVILPCHISPRLSAVDMEVRWFRERFDTPVHLYLNQRDQLSRQDSDYWGRTALLPEALQRGDLSLRLRYIRPSDRGVYTCLADDGSQYEEGQTEVIVAALGTQPSISMDSTQGEKTRLVCRSEGWSPEPEVIWRDRDGNDVTSLSNTTVQRDSQGLRSVSSYIKIKQQSNVFSCLVRSKIPKPDWESKLHISIDSLTLDPDTAHPMLILSAEGKRVRVGRLQAVHDNPERFDYWCCVLSREGFTSGRHYWQMNLGGNEFWRFGVSRESARRKGEFSMSPQQGYWTLGWRSGDEDKDAFIALTAPETPITQSLKPQKLGVYLDYEEGHLSFYNVETRSHIYTFTDMEFNPNEKLYPFFYTYSKTDLVLESPGPVSSAD